MKLCDRSGKQRYESRAVAQRAVAAMTARLKAGKGKADKRPTHVRPYQCPYCRDWHLTSSQYIPAVQANRLRRDIRRGLIEQQ